MPNEPTSSKPAQFEVPPIGMLFVTEYDQNNTDYPIIGVVRDPRVGVGQSTPEIGAACPDPRYPNHTFIGTKVTQWDQRILWLYQNLPGPTVPGAAVTLREQRDPLFLISESIATVEQSVDTGTAPPAIPGGSYGSSSAVTAKDEAVATLEEKLRTGNYYAGVLNGQEYDRRLEIVRPYTLQQVISGTTIGNAQTTVTPRGFNFDLSKVEAIPTDAYLAFKRSYPGMTSVSVPDVLQSVTIPNPISDIGVGESDTTGSSTDSESNNFSIQVSIPNSCEGNANVIYNIQPNIKTAWQDDKPVTDCFFFLQGPVVTQSGAIAAISTLFGLSVLPWPIFRPREEFITVTNQTLRARAALHVSGSKDAWANSTSSGSSSSLWKTKERSFSTTSLVETHKVRPTIHAAFSANPSTNANLSVAASVTLTGSIPASDATLAFTLPATASVNYSFTSTGVGAEDWPSGGQLYLKGLVCQETEDGMIMVRARLFDFANI